MRGCSSASRKKRGRIVICAAQMFNSAKGPGWLKLIADREQRVRTVSAGAHAFLQPENECGGMGGRPGRAREDRPDRLWPIPSFLMGPPGAGFREDPYVNLAIA